MSHSKKNTYVLSTIYGNALDEFRNAVGNYWDLGPFFPDYGDATGRNSAVLLTKRINKINTFKIIPRRTKVKNLKKYPFYEITHDFEVYADKGRYNNDTNWVNYVTKICSSGRVFLDYSFDVETPLSPEEMDAQSFNPGAVYNKANFVYNYYARPYELLTNNDQAPETILPNLYYFLSTRNDQMTDEAFQALTAGGELEESQLRSMRLPKIGNAHPAYFNEFGQAQRRTPLAKLDNISSAASQIIFDTDCDEILREGTDFATLFPMYVDLEFTTDSANEMTEVLKDSNLSTSLISYLSLIPRNPTEEQRQRFSMRTEPMQRFFESVTPNDDFTSTTISVDSEEVDVNIIDIDKWLKKVAKNKNFIRRGVMILQDDAEKTRVSNFEKMMYLIIFSGKLKTLVDKYNRSYLDISDGSKAFSETICYKVEKYSTDGGSEPMQTFWLPNTNEIDAIKYVDTQVKYNKGYRYKVSAYQFVVGSEYYYKNLQFPDEYDPPTQLQETLVETGQTSQQDFANASSSPKAFDAAEKPIPVLYLYDYPRYKEIMDPFNELVEDLPEEVASISPGRDIAQDTEVYDIIQDMKNFNLPVLTLETIATAFNTGETYPSYLDETKTLLESARRYLSTMKSLIEGFVKEYEDVYLPSVATDEKRDTMRTVSKDLRAALSWIYIIDSFYGQFEDFVEKYTDLTSDIEGLRQSAQETKGLGSTVGASIDKLVEERNDLITSISAVATQYHKYYDDLNVYLWKYQAIDISNAGSMQPAVQAFFAEAVEEQNNTQYAIETLSIPGVAGNAPAQTGPMPVATSEAAIVSNTDLETLGPDTAVTAGRQIVDKPYISSDKNIFKTKYANRLFVVPRKRQAVDTRKFYKANLQVCIRPSVKLVEVPFFETEGSIIDDPPVFPNVDLIPYRGIKDKILINLNSSVGSYKMMPITFSPKEEKIVEDIRQTQKIPSNSPITFTTDDSASAFEIYRLESPPEQIQDFANALRKYLPTDVNSQTLQKASSASFIDDINPNTEYYYTFRTVDAHGKISNPSPVYKLIMVENDGAVYPLIEVYQMKKIIPQKPTKTCKKLINIVPRYSQRLINLEKSNIGDGTSTKEVKNIVLGLEEKSLFGRKFKIRLTSKKTGKQLDLNVNFNVKLDKI